MRAAKIQIFAVLQKEQRVLTVPAQRLQAPLNRPLPAQLLPRPRYVTMHASIPKQILKTAATAEQSVLRESALPDNALLLFAMPDPE